MTYLGKRFDFIDLFVGNGCCSFYIIVRIASFVRWVIIIDCDSILIGRSLYLSFWPGPLSASLRRRVFCVQTAFLKFSFASAPFGRLLFGFSCKILWFRVFLLLDQQQIKVECPRDTYWVKDDLTIHHLVLLMAVVLPASCHSSGEKLELHHYLLFSHYQRCRSLVRDPSLI